MKLHLCIVGFFTIIERAICADNFASTYATKPVDVSIKDASWFVHVRSVDAPGSLRSPKYCGGALISKSCVITAVNCIYGYRADTTVTWGAERTEKGTTTDIEEYIVHPEYNEDLAKNNIVLLRLREPVKISPAVSIIPLAGPTTKFKRQCLFTSTPFSVNGAPSVENLRKRELKIRDWHMCFDCYKADRTLEFTKQHLCAGEAPSSMTEAELGAPLVCEELAGDKKFLVGIAVAILGTAPAAFADISKYNDWISKNYWK